MARIQTLGFETGSSSAGDGPVHASNGTNSVTSSAVRSGLKGLRITAASAWSEYAPSGIANRDRDFYFRIYMRISANPANTAFPFTLLTSAPATIVRLALTTTGTLQLQNNAGTQIGSDSAALTLNQWYRIEMRVRVSSISSTAGNAELRLDGATVASAIGTAQCGTTAPAWYRLGNNGASAISCNLDFDDVAVNDDQGANQTSYPGEGHLILLKPISDNARVGWSDGAGGTTALWESLNNIPPVGHALASAVDGSQIKDATNNATDTYDANMEAYNVYLGTNDTLVLIQSVMVIGTNGTVARNVGVKTLSNPAGSETTGATPASATSDFPTSWNPVRDAVQYAPTVTRSTSPVLRIRKATATTDSLQVCLLGLYVEYFSPLPIRRARQVASQVRRSPAIFST